MCESYDYRIQISDELQGKRINLRNFPELEIVYLRGRNELCPSNYSDAVCIWEGDLSLDLQVNGEKITLNDHDRQRKEKGSLATDQFKYTFQGLEPDVENRSRDQTYLIFSVERKSNDVMVSDFQA